MNPSMLLRALGIDLDEIMPQVEMLKQQLPQYARDLSAKVNEIESRLCSIEQKLDVVLENTNGTGKTDAVA